MECKYRLLITSLDSDGQWPLKQSPNDTSFLSTTCKDDQQLCGRDCIIGITIFVNENKIEKGAKGHKGDNSETIKKITPTIPYPYHVAYALHIPDPDKPIITYQADLSFSSNIDLSPGYNHIGWCGHTPINYLHGQTIQKNMTNNFPTLTFPGTQGSRYHHFSLSADAKRYVRDNISPHPYPLLHLMGANQPPQHVSVYYPQSDFISLRNLSILGAGIDQFSVNLSDRIEDLQGAALLLPLELNTSYEFHNIHKATIISSIHLAQAFPAT